MSLSFFFAHLLSRFGSWIFDSYLSTPKAATKNLISWSSAIIAFFLLGYLGLQIFMIAHLGLFFEEFAFEQWIFGKYFFLTDLLEITTLVLLAIGIKESTRHHKFYQISTTLLVLLNEAV